jgi:hypothetical protein
MAEIPAKDPDRIILGATKIGQEFDPPMTRLATYYHLEKGHIRAWKIGRLWATTPRNIGQAAVAELA